MGIEKTTIQVNKIKLLLLDQPSLHCNIKNLYLFRTHDVAAFANIGKILAQRCLECGITAVRCDIDATNSARYTALLNALKENGLELQEPPQYKKPHVQDKIRMVKPWTVEE